MKVCLVACPAGHLTELLTLSPSYELYDHFFVTHDSFRTGWLEAKGTVYLIPEIGVNPLAMMVAFIQSAAILIREKPTVVISTGTEIAIPFFFWAKMFGAKTVFIESWCRVRTASRTGRLAYPLADAFFVLWPPMLEVYGHKARYAGGLL
jgi:UDP-N-acetylglucosamine:LPS N-acetylglucosamine transferase